MLRRVFVLLILLLLALPWLKSVAYSSGGCTGMVCSLAEAGHGSGDVCPMKMRTGEHALGHKDAVGHSHQQMTGTGHDHDAGHETILSCNCDADHDSPFAASAAYLIEDRSFEIICFGAETLVTAAHMYEGPGTALPERPPSV
jgi:hypothetical protein